MQNCSLLFKRWIFFAKFATTFFDYEHLIVNKRGHLRCEFDLPRVTEARNVPTSREITGQRMFLKSIHNLLHVVPKMISSLPFIIFIIVIDRRVQFSLSKKIRHYKIRYSRYSNEKNKIEITNIMLKNLTFAMKK